MDHMLTCLLQNHRYVRRERRALHAEPLGLVLSGFLQSYFPQYVDYGFTSGMERQLDEVSGAPSPLRTRACMLCCASCLLVCVCDGVVQCW